MPIPEPQFQLPLAATMDLQYRLPPFQQVFFTPTIVISLILFAIAVIAVVYLSHRSRVKANIEARKEALKTAERILFKRGGDADDAQRVLFAFQQHPEIDPAAMIMLHDRFQAEFRPLLNKDFGVDFGERMEKIYFPPPKDTRAALAAARDVKEAVEETKAASAGQTAAAILDLMDATLKPGVVARLVFDGVEGGYECLIMGHDMQTVNVTLPAHSNQLVAALHPGTRVEGTLESGPSLIAFSASVVQAVAGSMPYCRITAWTNAWEVRTRDAVRLPISLDVDFQHISTFASGSIKMSNLNKEIGSLRPGRLMDVSLGGCCLETPSEAEFRVGDMIRFSKSLTPGNPPATLLGAVVNIDRIDPEENEGSRQRLHAQFLVIDDVSQRILVRAIRQLQDAVDREEWMQAQQLLQKMRRNRIQNIGSPASAGRVTGSGATRRGGRTAAGPHKDVTRPKAGPSASVTRNRNTPPKAP